MVPRAPLSGFLAAAPILGIAGCSGVQSALDPAGAEAEKIATLFWVMVLAGLLVWLFVIGLLLYAVRRDRTVHSEQQASRLILWGGAVFPSTALMILLSYALWLMPGLRPWAMAAAPALRIEVQGEQYWWRVRYRPADRGASVVSANEIRVPVGERVEFTLTSGDVIHSFWIPALGGKMDMIPGRTNRLSLMATKAGTFRGPCAEYCGTSHAFMAFAVVAMERPAFDQWLAARAEASPAAMASGHELFLRHGCGACHAIAGTEAQGSVGPDLSHVGSRETIAAGILPNTVEQVARFIAEPDVIKPGSHMPSFAMLSSQDIQAIAAYLDGLE